MTQTLTYKRALAAMMAFCVAISCLPLFATTAEAKTVTKSGTYYSEFVNFDGYGVKNTGKMTSKKIVLKGAVSKKYSNGYSSTKLAGKNFTFKLSPKAKYGFVVYDGFHRQSKAKFMSDFNIHGAVSLHITIKNGKAIKVFVSS